MQKKLSKLLLIIFMGIIFLTGCNKEETDAIKFKTEFESLNSSYQRVSISEDNHFVYLSIEKLGEMINNKESFVVFFGSAKDIESRHIVEALDKEVTSKKLSKIYYVDISSLENKYIINYNNEDIEVSSMYIVSYIKGEVSALTYEEEKLSSLIEKVVVELSSCDVNSGC